jgi:4,5-dihydroxyphthalate decarboxylase
VSDLNLSFASAVNERTRPIMDGTVRPEGITFNTIVSDPAETFWRMLRFADYDVSEMSISSFLIAKSHGADLVAIPAFPSRRFMHIELMCHVDAGIDGPEDLAGKRLGVGEYQQTAALWTRGILEHDFGVSQYDVEWFMERAPEQSHGAATGFRPPDGIKFHQVPPDRSLSTMLLAHELDAALVKRAMRKRSSLVERSSRLKVSPEEFRAATKPVFADPIAEGSRFFSTYGFVPVNHTYVLKGDVHRRHPWVALNVFKAMIEAKRVAEASLIDSIPLSLVFREEYLARTQEALGDDPFPYGLEPNRTALQTIIDYSLEQGLTESKAELDSLFAESTVAYSSMLGL